MIVRLIGFYRVFNIHNPSITLGYKCFFVEDITSQNGVGSRFDKPVFIDSSLYNFESSDDLGLYKLYFDSNARLCEIVSVA